MQIDEFSTAAKYYSYFLLFVLLSAPVFAQQFSPTVQNHPFMDYRAANQDWNVTIDEEGGHSANNGGVLAYDGQRWEFFPLEDHGIVCSVYAYGTRVYTKSIREKYGWARTMGWSI